MEAQKGFKPAGRMGAMILTVLLLLLLSPSPSSPIIAQEEAYPLIPLVMWADGYHAVDDVAYGVAVDFQGNAIVVGTSGVIKYAPDGRKLWRTEYDGVAYGVATDSLADIVVAGTAGLVKFSSAGQRLWTIDGRFCKVAVAAEDRIVAVGPEGAVAFGPEGERLKELAYDGEPYGVASSDGDVVIIGTGGIVKYDLESGRRLWEAAPWGEPRDVATDSDGNVIVVGSKGISKYSPAGALEWRELFLGEPQAVTTFPVERLTRTGLLPPGDQIIVTGGFKNRDWDYRTVKYDSKGKEIWDSRYDGRYGDDIPYDIAVSAEGFIYVTGTSTLAKEQAGAGGEPPPAIDQDYYTIQYAERPLPEALESRGLGPEELEEVCPPETLPLAEFEVSNTNPLTDEEISFINRSDDPDGYLIAWSWEFGDGTTSAEWEPEHRYGRKGNYTVTLTVVDDQLCPADAAAEITIGNRPPEVDFWWTPLEPTDLEEALFTPEFEDPDGEVVYARWEFGDSTVVEWDSEWELGPPGRRSRIAHQYPDNDTYTVRLVVVDDDGAEAEVEKEITVLNVPPEVEFDWESTVEFRADFEWGIERETHGDYLDLDFNPQWDPGDKPTDLDTVEFIDRSVLSSTVEFSSSVVDLDGEVVSYLWDFGDGNTSDEPNPSHQYAEAGTYTVTLTVTDDDGDTTTFTQTIEVEVGGEITEWHWDMGGAPGEFDNGTSASSQNPHFWFSDDGTYEVTLTVEDTSGNTASVTKEIEVLNIPPVTNFSSMQRVEAINIREPFFTWTVEREQHGSYPEGFSPEEATDLDDLLFDPDGAVSGGETLVDFFARAEDTDGEIVSYRWDFDGDGQIDAEGPQPHVTWIPEEPGTYETELTVVDDDGASASYRDEVSIESVGIEIVAWEWDFDDGGTSTERYPTHHFQDDGVYEVTLTVYDQFGESYEGTEPITILNVPPVADFDWGFEVPEWFLPTCEDLLEEEIVAAGLAGAALLQEWGGGTACQEPDIPGDAGVVAFKDRSYDSEPWLAVAEWLWEWDLDGYGICWEGEDCETAPDPWMVFLWDTAYGESFLYHGDVDVTLQVWDDDGEGGLDYDFSNVTQTLTIANIPPYAAFRWEDWGGFAELSCSGCEETYGSGDPTKQASNEQVTVTRTIYSWDCGFGEEPNAILAPWGAAGVELIIGGAGTVEVTETLPADWGYWLGWTEECVAITDQGADYWSASVDLDACGGSTSIWYDLYPPYEGPTGSYTVSGVFTVPEVSELTLASGIVLCANVDVEDTIYFYGYGWDELWMADPNGDELVSYDWDFREFGTASGQEPEGGPCGLGECSFTFENLACEYDGFDWVWSYAGLEVALTVTDGPGDSTTVEELIPLSGPCGGMPE